MYMKRDFERASETFDSIAEHFDRTRNRAWKEVIDFLDRREGKLLDMGCGNGRHLIDALKKGFDVVGVDASIELLGISSDKIKKETREEGSPKTALVRADVKRLPLKKNSFDHVIYIAAIHHLKRGRVDSLKEAKRVLKPRGNLLVSSWARELDRWDLDKEERDVIVPWHRDDGEVVDRFYHLYTLDGLERDVKRSGLEVVQAYHSRGNNYIEALKKA